MKTILSIDGGGIRGLIPAMLLAAIERRTGRRIAELFDLVAGTSTGGILALGLVRAHARGGPAFSAARLADIYARRGGEIFSRSLWRGVSSVGGLLDETYSHQGIETVLEDHFGDQPLGAALTRVLVTAYDIERREPVFFKSWKKSHREVAMRLAARATSAAPTYFEPARFAVDGELRALIDGGVFLNNPAVSAYAEARRLFPRERRFLVLSLGTGELSRRIPYELAKDWGRAEWALPLMACIFDGVSDAANYQLEHLIGGDFYRFQTSLSRASDDMDDATAGNVENLKSEARALIRGNADRIGEVCGRLLDRR